MDLCHRLSTLSHTLIGSTAVNYVVTEAGEVAEAIHNVLLVSKNDSLITVVHPRLDFDAMTAPTRALLSPFHISRVIHPPAVPSSLHVLPAAYICLAN